MNKLRESWRETQEKYIFDPIQEVLNFNAVRPTAYKHNKFVRLPQPMTNDEEFKCETRPRKYMDILKEYKETEGRSSGELRTKSNIEGDKSTKGGDRIKRKERKGRKLEALNLPRAEQVGLDNLKRRVSKGELIITTTDKSSRLAILRKDQYVKAGEIHTKKDKCVTWRDIKYLQGQVNEHTWWI